jgi:hypothetical protein
MAKQRESIRSEKGERNHSAKRKLPARKSIRMGIMAAPTPLVKIVSVQPPNPVTPCQLVVNACCRMAGGQTCDAYLADTAMAPTDLFPVSTAGTPLNPRFTFNLNTPNKTYALEVFITNSSHQVVASDGTLVNT